MKMRDDTEQRLAEGILGTTHDRIALLNREHFALACERLAAQCRHRLDIFTFNLDHPLYDQAAFIEPARTLAIHSRDSRIRILLQENQKIQQIGHQLLHLVRKLPSKIEIRRTYIDYIDHPENFLIADNSGFVHRKEFAEYQGEMNFNDPLTVERLSELFARVWERSEQDTDLRQLSI